MGLVVYYVYMAISTEELQYHLSRFEDWTKNADVKLGVILAFDGAILAAIMKHAFNLIFNQNTPNYILAGYIAALVLLVWSIGKALWAILPRLSHQQGKTSLLFFSDVSQMKLKEYKSKLGGLTTAKYREEVIAQMHAIAKVANTRMSLFRDSIVLLAASLLVAGGMEVWLRLINL